MTRLTLRDLIEALEVPEVSSMDKSQFRFAREQNMTRDEMFQALLQSEGLTACQEKIMRWVHDLYQGEPMPQ